MAKYFNITSGTTTTLLKKNTNDSGKISSIYICNYKDASTTIAVAIFDDSNTYYLVQDLVVPANTSLLLDDCVTFDAKKYSLKINYSASPTLTVIIK